MSHRLRRFRPAAASLAVAAVCAVFFTADIGTAQSRGARSEGRSPRRGETRDRVQTFGSGAETFYFVDHGKRVSIWVRQVPADKLLEELGPWGGPTFTSHEPFTRPVTFALNRVKIEEVFRRMLDGYNFAYYYERDRVSHIKIIGSIPGRVYKTPKVIMPKDDWEDLVFGNR